MNITFQYPLRGSDLILHEQDPFVAYCRADTVVTLAGAQKLQLGSLLFRPKAAAPGKYTPVTSALELVDTNEFAVYYADQLGRIMETEGAGDHKVESIVRGEIILKDKAIYDAVAANGLTLDQTQKDTVKNLLAKQHIIVEKVLLVA